MRSIIKNKRGDLPSLIMVLVILIFVLAIVSLLFSFFFKEILSEVRTMDGLNNNTIETIDLVDEKTIPFLDYLVMFSFISVLIGLIISAIYVDTHPAVVIIFIVFVIVGVVLSGILANAFTEVAEDAELSSTYDEFRYTNLIINNFPLLVFISAIIVGIILYSKSKVGVGA